MKKLLLSTIFTVIAFVFAGAGCSSPPKSRVVRLMPNTNQTEWRFSVDGKACSSPTTLDQLTNRLGRLQLQHGDIVLFGKLPQFNSNQAKNGGDWLTRYFDSSKVAMYVYPETRSWSIFSVPAYHWVAPFENPRNTDKASFFIEGKFLGTGMDGYQSMARDIERSHRPRVFVLGSLYDWNTGFGPLEEPYENQKQLLDDALKKDGTERLYPSELPGL